MLHVKIVKIKTKHDYLVSVSEKRCIVYDMFHYLGDFVNALVENNVVFIWKWKVFEIKQRHFIWLIDFVALNSCY